MKKSLLFFVMLSGMLCGCSGDNASSPSSPHASSIAHSAPPSSKLSPMEKIRARGVLLVGVKVDTPRMCLLNPLTNEFEGMEVDIARLLAKRIFGDEARIRIKPVTPKNRINKLNEEFVDIVIGAFTIQDQRKNRVHFSDPYLSDGLAFLVRKADHMQRIAELEGKKVGITEGTIPANRRLPKIFEKRNLNTEVVVYPGYSAAKVALQNHKVDALCSMRASLYGYVDNDLEIMKEMFQPGSYGIGIKLGNQELVDYVNEFLREMQSNGTLDTLKNQWHIQDVFPEAGSKEN